jgi:hypothetical protein
VSGHRWRFMSPGREVELQHLDYTMAWEWILRAEGGERRVVVWVNRTVWASRSGGELPVDVLDAIAVRGRWAVERYLHWREPPLLIEVTTKGLHPSGGSRD